MLLLYYINCFSMFEVLKSAGPEGFKGLFALWDFLQGGYCNDIIHNVTKSH